MALAKRRGSKGPNCWKVCPRLESPHKRGVVTGVGLLRRHPSRVRCKNCAGMWARQLGDEAGVNIPLQAAEHYYLITEKIPQIVGLARD